MFISPPALLEHWQGHRRLTRRVIDAFPEDTLLTYSVASMRPFGALAMGLVSIAEPMVRGIVTSDWTQLEHPPRDLEEHRSRGPRVRRCDGARVRGPEVRRSAGPKVATNPNVRGF